MARTISRRWTAALAIAFVAALTTLVSGSSWTVVPASGQTLPATPTPTTPSGGSSAKQPDPPTITQVSGADERATVSWLPPANNGGSPITGYHVFAAGGGSVVVPGHQLFVTITGLENGESYQFAVAAINSVGASAPTPLSEPVVPFGPATAPTNVAVASPAEGELRVAWEPPLSDEGSAITGYRIDETNSLLPSKLAGADDTFVDYLEVPLGIYRFRVIALNRAGGSEVAFTDAIQVAETPPITPGPSEPGRLANPTVTDIELDEIEAAFDAAVAGGAERIDGSPSVRVAGRSATLTLPISVGSEVSTATLSLRAGNIHLDMTEGQGFALIGYGGGVSLSGDAVLSRDEFGRVAVVISAPRLRLQPSFARATIPQGAEFDVALEDLPGSTVFEMTYSPDIGGMGLTPGRIALAASRRGVAASPGRMVTTFAVRVAPTPAEGVSLLDNRTTLRLSSSWPGLAAGNLVLLVKASDSGDIFIRAADCLVSGTVARCSATFDGAASGFSTFTIVALKPVPEPTPTFAPPTPTPNATATVLPPTPLPTPTASPTPTVIATATLQPSPTAVSDAEATQTAIAAANTIGGNLGRGGGGGGIVLAVAGVVIIAAAAGAGAIFLYGRRQAESAPGGRRSTVRLPGMD